MKEDALNTERESLLSQIEELKKERDENLVFKDFFKQSNDLVCIADNSGHFTHVSASFVELLGYTEEELKSRPFTDFVYKEDLSVTAEEYDGNKDGASSYDFENRYVKKDGSLVTLQWRSNADPDRELIYAVARDVTRQKELEFELKHKQELLQASQSVALLGNFSYNTVDYSLFWSDELYNIFGISEEEKSALYDAYVARFDKEGLDLYSKIVEEAMQTGNRYEFQHKVHIPGGRVKTVSCVGIPFTDNEGKVYRIDGVVQDITEQIANEEIILNAVKEKELLIKELHHRVKNNLQVISSLLNLQSNLDLDSSTQSHLKECQNRIKSMASIHDMLYRSNDITNIEFTDYLKQLTDDLVKSYLGNEHSLRINYDMDEVHLSLDMAVPMGLLINEIVTNSLKHAYSEEKGLDLNIQMKHKKDGFTIEISDNGAGFNIDLVDFRKTLGLMIVDTLSDQLEANHDLKSDATGTTHFITVGLK